MSKVVQATKDLSAGIVGCGRIASLFARENSRQGVTTHAQAYRNHHRTRLDAAADIDTTRLDDFKRTWNPSRTYSDFREMICKEKLDILSLCTPTHTHFEIAKFAIENGVKAIFCEKPMVATLAEADALEKLVKEKNVIFTVNHSRRWDPMELNIQKFIADGKLGKIQCIDAYYTAGIANTGSHLIDLLRMLTKQEVNCVLSFKKLGASADPTIDGVLQFSDGFFAFLHGLDVKAFLRFEVDICGTIGRILIRDSGFGSAYWKVTPHSQFPDYKELECQETAFGEGYQNVFPNALNNIINALEGKEPVLSDISEGKKTLEILVALRESILRGGCKYATDGQPGYEFPLKNRNAGLI